MKDALKKIRNKLIDNNCEDDEIYALLKKVETKLELAENIERCLYDSELYLVYKHTDPLGKAYIGITQNHPQTRWNDGSGYEKQTKFYRAIQRFGWLHFDHEILAAGLSKEEAVKMENEMIIFFKTYDEKYGYNVKVDLGEKSKQIKSIELDSSKPVKKEREKSRAKKKSLTDISKEIIRDYSIKTLNEQIYYLKGGKYVLEENAPFLEKVLIINYEIPTKFHKEIFRQIKIISSITLNSLNEDEKHYFVETEQINDILCWMNNCGLDEAYLFTSSTREIYEEYRNWCFKFKTQNYLGKKQFFKSVRETFNLEQKQRSDGKRYFIKIN